MFPCRFGGECIGCNGGRCLPPVPAFKGVHFSGASGFDHHDSGMPDDGEEGGPMETTTKQIGREKGYGTCAQGAG